MSKHLKPSPRLVALARETAEKVVEVPEGHHQVEKVAELILDALVRDAQEKP